MSETQAFFTRSCIEIRVAHLASGMNYWYAIWGSEIRVIADDSTAEPPKVLYDEDLTDEQQTVLRKCIAEVPIRELKSWHETPGVIDGVFIEFRISDGHSLQRVIRVLNCGSSPKVVPG